MAQAEEPLLGRKEPQQNQVNITKLLAGLIGVFLASADKSILLATQGEIASSLNSPASAPLLLVSYNLGFCIALPLYGFLSDIYGCRWFLLSAYALFSLGCLISGVVTSLWPFIIGRFVTGIGGAGMTDLLSVLINEVFPMAEVASMRSYVIAAGILGQACGGPLGGLVTDMAGWRWSLIGQAPIGLLCMGIACLQLPISMRVLDLHSSMSLWNFDWCGIITFFFAFTSFILGTTDSDTFFSPSTKPALLIASCFFLALFITIEKFGAKNPIISPSVVGAPGLGSIFLGQVVYFASISTILNNLPTILYRINHLSNSSIALQIGISGLGLILGSIIAGKFLRKNFQCRKLSLVAISISILAQIIMIGRWRNGIQGLEIHYCFPWAIGSGLLLSAQFITLSIRSPPEQMASATAVYYLSQQVGLILGTSVSTVGLQRLFEYRLEIKLADILPSERKKLIAKLIADFGFISTLSETLQAAVEISFIEAYRFIPIFSAILTIILAFLVFFSKEKSNV